MAGSVEMDEDMLETLEAESRATGIPLGVLIRQLLRDELDDADVQLPPDLRAPGNQRK